MADGSYTTYWDIVQHLLDVSGTGGGAQDRDVRMAKRAVLAAYRDVPAEYDWGYLTKRHRLEINAAYDTGTIEYDHTGGASERLVTLTSGTFPSWAASGVLYYSGIPYQVDTRESSTTLTLSSDSNPGEDISSGASYILYQDHYTLPTDFHVEHAIRNSSTIWNMTYTSPANWEFEHDSAEATGVPRRYTYMGDRDNTNRMALYIYPPSDSAYKWDLIYKRVPVPVKVLDYSDKTVTVSGTTVTGASTAWTSDMVGSVFRIGDATNVPDGREGDEPFKEEVLITAVGSATSLTIASALSGTYTSATKYRISDLIDIEPGPLLTYFQSYAELQHARMLRNDDYQQRFIAIDKTKRMAMAADSRHAFGDRAHWEPIDIFDLRTTADYS